MSLDPTPREYRASSYRNPAVNQMHQPLPPPHSERSDLQRIAAGSQFTGRIPNDDPGDEGSASPTSGGRWMYAGDTHVEIHFRTIGGVEPGPGRTAGSGIFVRRKGAITDTLLATLTGVNATLAYFALTGDAMIHLNMGDILKVITNGATLEMEVIVKVFHKPSRRGSY